MKHLILAASLAAAAVPAMAADVAVSITAGAPNFYGRIDIGNAPQPVLVNPQPVIVRQPAPTAVVVAQPLYLRVPPGHMKDWKKHCHRYDACGQQVYFVQDNWYQTVYVPHYREHHGKDHDHDHDRDGDRDHDKEHGKGHGKGHDKD